MICGVLRNLSDDSFDLTQIQEIYRRVQMTGEQFEQYHGCYGLQEEPTVI